LETNRNKILGNFFNFYLLIYQFSIINYQLNMTFASVFSGIGVPDLAAQMLGWDVRFQCENDTFCRSVLQYHFPDAELFDDIKKSNFKKYAKTIDIICGGFPCQPFSYAGKRKGTGDNRYLWKEMYRCIKQVLPRWFVIENVSGLLTIEQGMVLETLYTDLATAGYEVSSPFVIPACAVNAPHRRDRVWIVAHRANARAKKMQCKGKNGILQNALTPDTNSGNFPNNQSGQSKQRLTQDIISAPDTASERRIPRDTQKPQFYTLQDIPNWENFPTQSPVCNGNDGIADRLSFETIFEGIRCKRLLNPFGRWRRESIKALGNAIVLPLIYEIFKIIDKIND
jgi:DNA (cytosine-5)-methyltransferase 1